LKKIETIIQQPLRKNLDIPFPIRMLFLALSLGATFYSWYEYVGLYRWLTELQQLLFAGYFFPELSFVLMLVIHLWTTVFMMNLLVPFFTTETVTGKNSTTSKTQRSSFVVRLDTFITTYPRLTLFGIASPLVFAGVGLGFIGYAMTLGGHRTITLASLLSRSAPPTSWVTITEAELDENQVSSLTDDHNNTSYFMPLVINQEKSGQPVTYLIRVNEYHVERSDNLLTDATTKTFTGILKKNGLPGTLKADYPHLTSPHWLLDYRNSPDAMLEFGQMIFSLGLITLVPAILYIFVKKIKL
jgi:hypothetical protein